MRPITQHSLLRRRLSHLLRLAAALTASTVASASPAVQTEADFSKRLQTWDGFGVNYVETAQTRDYRTDPEDYGGLSRLTEPQRQEIVERVFGDDGLQPGLVKMFLDPFHEGYGKAANDNDDPHVLALGGYDHETTTKWMRYFARAGLARTRARGGDLQIVTTLYGPAPWMTKQKFVRGRDLDPAEKYELGEYMISWAKYLREIEGLPVKYISLHNEGEIEAARKRWPADGSTAGPVDHDHNLFWPADQVLDFLRFMRGMLDEQGMQDVGLTQGEPAMWQRLTGVAGLIAEDPRALRNLGLITSHGFGRNDLPTAPKRAAIELLRAKRPELHAWTTSMTWGDMDAQFLEGLRIQIYDVGVNGIIPWAAVQRVDSWIGGDPNNGTAFNIDEHGRVHVRPGYYFYKQLSRAGQPGMAVASVATPHDDIKLVAFARNGTGHPDAFSIINLGATKRAVSVRIRGSEAKSFRGFRTTQDGRDRYAAIGNVALTDGAVGFESPGGSATTFFAESTSMSATLPKTARAAGEATGGALSTGQNAGQVEWGNGLYIDMAIGQTHEFLGRKVRLLSVGNDHCTVAVDDVKATLRMARRDRPAEVNGVRIFVADTRPVAGLVTNEAFPLTHAIVSRDAVLCVSDPALPLLDPTRFTFPISRVHGYKWTMDENSGMFAYLSPQRSHEGIDLNLHEARGRELHPVVAVENGTVRWAVPTENANEACLLLESEAQPGIFYIYQHLNRDRLQVKTGDKVKQGQRLAYIWGDWRWGHLHFSVVGRGPAPDYPSRYRHVLNAFPQLYELWHGSLAPAAEPVTSGHFRFAEIYYHSENRLRLQAFSETVGYGWLLGEWCAAGGVEYLRNRQPGQSARLSKILHANTAAAALNPNDWFDFEVVARNGDYRVTAEVGDAYRDTWQRVEFEGQDAGTYELASGDLAWTAEKLVPLRDGRLTIRLHLKDGATPAGLRNLNFVIVAPYE